MRQRANCNRCSYEWRPHVECPKRCARCRSPLWDKPRVYRLKARPDIQPTAKRKRENMQTRQIAEDLATRLLTNGAGQRAERLALLDSQANDLGGWGFKPLAHQIELAIIAGVQQALEQAELIAMAASVTIADRHHEQFQNPPICRFEGAVAEDAGSDGVTCFACCVQDLLAKIRVEALMKGAMSPTRH